MQKPSVLLIDDSAMMRRFIALFLSKKYHVTDCETAEEALDIVGSGYYPQLIVTDLDLPGMPGLELMRSFRQSMPYTPVIVVSGATDSKTRLEALAAGADDFLVKPFHPGELDVRIQKLLHREPGTLIPAPANSGILGAFQRITGLTA